MVNDMIIFSTFSSPRLIVTKAFTFILGCIFLALIAFMLVLWKYQIATSGLLNVNRTTTAYNTKITELSLEGNEMQLLGRLTTEISALQELEIPSLNLAYILVELEGVKKNGIRFNVIDYKGDASHCVLEFYSESAGFANDFIGDVEGIEGVGDVVLQKRENKNNQFLYTLEVRF